MRAGENENKKMIQLSLVFEILHTMFLLITYSKGYINVPLASQKSVAASGWPSQTLARLLDRPSGYERRDNEGISKEDDYVESGNNSAVWDDYKVAVGNLVQDVGYLWRDLPFPVIAALHGVCFGGGKDILITNGTEHR
jgi:hypothetical protein